MPTSKVLAKQEKQRLDTCVQTYRIGCQDEVVRRLAVRTVAPFINRGVALEVGCSDGFMTELIVPLVDSLDVVEGSKKFLDQVKRRHLPNVNCIHALIEECSTEKRYDCVFATFILTHLLDVQVALKVMRRLMKPRGVLFAVVPNARVLSRQLALHMGLVEDLYALTENDLKHGHRRAYDRASLNKELECAGFDTLAQGGIMMKILADFQMERLFRENILRDEHIEGLYKLGLEYPDLSGYLFSVCRKKS
jgi:2-polyprenyl-3-methyl-5-hydroxy-6-metoxy-1,4-benzoquinol methylase